MRHVAPLLAALLTATGCVSLPVKGEMKNSDEIFVGEATGFAGGIGNLTIVSSRGTRCSGHFQYSAPIGGKSGTGAFDCEDGRRGTFVFNSTGLAGVGFGSFGDGQQVRFTFGHGAAVSPSMW